MKNIIALCLCIVLAVSSASTGSQEQPDQIIEVFRHGARVVLGDYDPSWPSNEYGELTPVGMRQHYILGRALAKKYPHLLGSNYNYSQVYVLSDTTPRCIQSAMSQLYGIYLGSGPSLNSTYPPELAVPPYQDPFVQELAMSLGDSAALPHGYVPAIVQIVDASNGFTFSSDGSTFCPNDNLWTDQNLNSSKLTSGMQPFNTTIQNINAYFNNSLTISDYSDVWDEIEVDLIENRTNPAGIENPELISNFTFASSWLSMYTYMNQKVQRQVASFGLVTAIISQLTNFRQGETFNTAALYSGHDGDIWAILGAFGVVTEECLLANFESYVANGTTPYVNCYYPGFAANLVFEFYNSTDAPYVKLYYNNVIVPLCNGQDACSYDEFISFANNAIGNRTVQDYFQKCGTNMTYVSEYYAPKIELISQEGIIAPKFNLRTEILIIIGLVILCSILLIKIIADQKKYNKNFSDLMHQRMLYDEDNNVRLQ